jgi:DNA-binding transcriptional LysR family regulator
MNITTVNLNLFVVFDALVAERNVTRAAKRLGVTQSAVSNALRQLRSLFDDPLFLRRSAGVEPTPRALALVEPVRRGLDALGDALAPPRFDAKTADRRFVIATSDYVELVLLPPLLARLSAEAPGVRLEIVPWGLHEVPALLARGEADLMIGYYGRVPPAHRDVNLFTAARCRRRRRARGDAGCPGARGCRPAGCGRR